MRSKSHSAALASLNQELWQEAERHSEKGASISHMVRWIEQVTGTEITSAI